MEENIHHPSHYNQHLSGIECIEINEHFDYCLGCAFKYIWRYQKKGSPTEDLKKAKWYIERSIANGVNILSQDKQEKIKEKIKKVIESEFNVLKNKALEMIFLIMCGEKLYAPLLKIMDDLIKVSENVERNTSKYFN